jgi:catechol 2,3-dioxygenase-like lactoylglutathione lyase family enzyme
MLPATTEAASMNTTTRLKLKGVDHINFACADLERTIAFWRSVGVEPAFDLVLHDPERHHVFFKMGEDPHASYFSYWCWTGRELTAAQEHDDRHHAGFYHIAFHVDTEDELEEMHAHMVAAGVKVSEITGRHLFDKSFYFRDPDGIQFEFACPVLTFEGMIDHDGNGTLRPLSPDAKLGRRRLDGPVHFETKYK